MLFKKKFIPLIFLGYKTQTRRNWKKRMVKKGNQYMVKDRWFTSEYYGKIEVTNIRRQPLKLIDDIDAVCEGFNSAEDFLKEYIAINSKKGKYVNVWETVYVIEFKTVCTTKLFDDLMNELFVENQSFNIEKTPHHKIMKGGGFKDG